MGSGEGWALGAGTREGPGRGQGHLGQAQWEATANKGTGPSPESSSRASTLRAYEALVGCEAPVRAEPLLQLSLAVGAHGPLSPTQHH